MCLTICVTHHWQCTLESSSKSTNYDNGILHVTPTRIPMYVHTQYVGVLHNVREFFRGSCRNTHTPEEFRVCVCHVCVCPA